MQNKQVNAVRRLRYTAVFAILAAAFAAVVMLNINTGSVHIPADRILHPCRNSCPFHHALSRNLFDLISRRNVALTEKIEITSKSSLREKILAYLSLEAQKAGSMKVTIPLSRSEMADYLCTNRSALSRELANMKKDGILDYDLRTFHLLQVPDSK